MIFEEIIKPYTGTETFKLYDCLDNVIKILKDNHILYNLEKWSGDDETVPNPWTVVKIEGIMSLFFTDKNNKLFKICFYDKYKGKLENGINFETDIDDINKIDSTITYDDFDEVYISKNGYWLDSNLDNNKVFSIQVFIKEIDNEDFGKCNW